MFCSHMPNEDEDEVLSPANAGEIVRFTDEGIAEYIELPEDTHFVESVAYNPKYAVGVGYVPVQRKINGKTLETHIYEIRPGMTEAKHLFGPITTSKGTDCTVFGSALTSDGILYLCAFNQNCVIDFDLKALPETADGEPVKCNLEIGPFPSPNDVCVDPEDERTIYVGGGTFRKIHLLFMEFTNSAYGQVFQAKVNEDRTTFTKKSVCKGLKTIAGVGVKNKQVWVAQLFNILTLSQDTDRQSPRKCGVAMTGTAMFGSPTTSTFTTRSSF